MGAQLGIQSFNTFLIRFLYLILGLSFIFILFTCLLTFQINNVAAKCSMKGGPVACDMNLQHKLLYLYEDGEPMTNELDQEAQELLKKRCPEFYTNSSNPVCCTSDQVKDMDKSFQLAEQVFGRCHTCVQNMLRSICGMTCSPNQADFIKVKESQPSVSQPGQTCVHEINYLIDESYMNGTYDSCDGVLAPSTGIRVMGLSCGGNTVETCTPQKWFDFMGDASGNPFTPFQINYIPTSGPGRFEWAAKPCNESYDGFYTCSCVDCQSSCPPSDFPLPEDRWWTVGPFNGPAFVVAMVVGGVSLLIILCGGVLLKGRQLPEFPIRGWATMDVIFARFFTYFGTWIAKHPVLVLAIFSWFLIGLGYGATKLKIVTDPVELWSAPNSRARVEKDYFDSRFGPFYRTEQIFFKPKSNERVSAA